MNPKKGFLTVKLANGEKYLRFTTEALVNVEDKLGVSVTELMANIATDEKAILRAFGFKQLAIFIWAGVQGAGSKLSHDAIIKLMSPKDYAHYAERVTQALMLAMGFDEQQEEDQPPSEGDEFDPTLAAVPELGTGTD